MEGGEREVTKREYERQSMGGAGQESTRSGAEALQVSGGGSARHR